MKIQNSTDWHDAFLRAMTSWCCKQIGMKVRGCKLAVFRNSKSTWGGCARYWRRQISVCVTKNEAEFPASCSTHKEGERFIDRIECLVAVTAHELYHIAAHVEDMHKQNTRGYGHGKGSSERMTCAEEMRVLGLFRQQRGELLAQWQAAVIETPAVPLIERRKAKAQADLAKWVRKLKLAQTKVKKYTRAVKRYEQA